MLQIVPVLHEYDITFYVPKRYDVVLGPSDFLGINILLKNGILNSIQYNLKDKNFQGGIKKCTVPKVALKLS